MSITEVPGILVGQATDRAARTGVTTVLFEAPATVGVAVHGGAPGTRETDALNPTGLAPPVDAICLSGGSAFGLAAADGVQRALYEEGRGYPVGPHRVPIVPGAIVFDLTGPPADFAKLGRESLDDASHEVAEGTVGAGTNATTATVKGGVGSASERVGEAMVGAIVVVNAFGSITAANGPWFRAAPFEREAEFGGLTAPADADWTTLLTKASGPRANTAIAVVATDATLTGTQATRLAITAHDAYALAIWPAHTLFDGDTVFAASTAGGAAVEELAFVELCAAATRALTRAIARAAYFATPAEGDRVPTWRELAARPR